MKVRPLHDRILVQRLDAETKTAGGAGKIGDDGKRRPMGVKAGDRILFSKYGGSDVKIDGNEHLIVREEDVLAVLE